MSYIWDIVGNFCFSARQWTGPSRNSGFPLMTNTTVHWSDRLVPGPISGRLQDLECYARISLPEAIDHAVAHTAVCLPFTCYSAKYYKNQLTFGKIIAEIKSVQFFSDSVDQAGTHSDGVSSTCSTLTSVSRRLNLTGSLLADKLLALSSSAPSSADLQWPSQILTDSNCQWTELLQYCKLL